MMTNPSLQLSKYSIGVGDRFSMQGIAQLQACVFAMQAGVEVIPVWNKSNREHNIIGSDPSQTRRAADAAVQALGWVRPFFIDADHVELNTVDRFIEPCDFFTIDVAHKIGIPADHRAVVEFMDRHPELISGSHLDDKDFQGSPQTIRSAATRYLNAISEAGRIYRYIERHKGTGKFIPEISMDETDSPQQPVELLVILAAIADEKIPIQTIAPKFAGRFNKGIDYRGDPEAFARDFSADLDVLAHAVKNYDLPRNLKLSVHSGSDKFSLYPLIHRAIHRVGAGLHLKTAGTTWLEELAGLALSGGSALDTAREIYAQAYGQIDELCKPYISVIAIDRSNLPSPQVVTRWTAEQYAGALHHHQDGKLYNPDLRQLLHVSFKVAAKLGQRFLDAVTANKDIIAPRVTANLFERHIRPVFIPH